MGLLDRAGCPANDRLQRSAGERPERLRTCLRRRTARDTGQTGSASVGLGVGMDCRRLCVAVPAAPPLPAQGRPPALGLLGRPSPTRRAPPPLQTACCPAADRSAKGKGSEKCSCAGECSTPPWPDAVYDAPHGPQRVRSGHEAPRSRDCKGEKADGTPLTVT